MRVLRNDSVDTMTSTAKKVMTSFKNKQTQWEQNIPFGKKKEAKAKKNFSSDTPLSSTNTNIRSNMAVKLDSDGNVPETVAKAAQIMPKLDKSELIDLPMASAKPSAIAAAAKKKRIANMAETKAAKERQRKAAEQQMKMNRYRDEIAAIKKKQEAEENSKGKNKKRRGKNDVAQDAVQKVLTKEVTEEDENAVLGYKEEDFQKVEPPPTEESGRSLKFIEKDSRRKSVLDEMKGSFHAAIDLVGGRRKKSPKGSSTPVSDRKSRLRPAPRRGSLSNSNRFTKKKSTTKRSLDSSSHRVPEMRRRPNQADLLYVETENAAPETGNGKNFKGTQWNKEKLINEKQQKEKQAAGEQKKKLEEAEEAFKKGHNLCWQINDSAAALQEYRTALFIRESLLGKYHEQTGRTYFWIGKSLVKLDEFNEALVAFSRSLRIFDRIVQKEHKYYKWTIVAIDECIERMEDPHFRDYKARLHASIQFELEGDTFRKQGEMAEAIAKYRDAIDHVEDYHPDAADLYSKIALILRQDGDFDRAQEEYRFACEIYEMSLGADHPETVKALNEVMEKKRLGQLTNMLKNKLNLKA